MASEHCETTTPGPAGANPRASQGKTVQHHTCRQHTEDRPWRAWQWTTKMLHSSRNCPDSFPFTHLMVTAKSARSFLTSQQAPENLIGRMKANCLGRTPNLYLAATINITLGVADAHKRGE